MARRKLKKEEMRRDPFREFLGKVFSTTELSLEHHWRAYLIGFAIFIAAVICVYYFVDLWQQKGETSSMLLTEVSDISQAPVLPAGDPQRADYLKAGQNVYSSQDERSADLKKKVDELIAKGASGSQKKAALFFKASDLARSGSYPEAVKILEELEKDSDFESSALQLKARIFEMQNESAKAEAVYTQISTLKADDLPEPMGLSILGQFYERQGRKSDAVKTYENALKAISAAKPKAAAGDQSSAMKKDAMESKLKEKIKELNT